MEAPPPGGSEVVPDRRRCLEDPAPEGAAVPVRTEVPANLLVPDQTSLLAGSRHREKSNRRGDRGRDLVGVGPESGEDLDPHVASPQLAVAGAVTCSVPTLPAWDRSSAIPAALVLGVWGASLGWHRLVAVGLACSHQRGCRPRRSSFLPATTNGPVGPLVGEKASRATLAGRVFGCGATRMLPMGSAGSWRPGCECPRPAG